jgi:hypothetical protein
VPASPLAQLHSCAASRDHEGIKLLLGNRRICEDLMYQLLDRDNGKGVKRLIVKFLRSQSYDGAQCVENLLDGIPLYKLSDARTIKVGIEVCLGVHGNARECTAL